MRIPGKATLRRPLLVGLLACTLVASGGIANAEPASPSDGTTTESAPTTTTKPAPTTTKKKPAPATTESAPPETSTESAPSATSTNSPAATTESAPAETSTKPAPSTIKEVPREKIPPSGDALITAPGEAPPSAFEAADPPAREANPQRSDRDYSALSQQRSSGQQKSMTLDEIPELPAGVAPRSETEPIAEGFTKEEADLSERMEYALNSGCQTYWPSPYAVCGEIRNKYNAMGGPASFLSFPKSPEYQNPGATGFRSEFINGSIYWSPATGAHPVTLLYMAKWAEHDWETGFLGYPTNDEIGNNDGQGSHQEFQGAGVYWHPIQSPMPAVIGGAIRTKWETFGAEGGVLGYPTTDERTLPDLQGKMNRFFNNGVIYWSPNTGAHPVFGTEERFTGRIMGKWAAANWEVGPFGYPIEDEQWLDASRVTQKFEGGTIGWPYDLASDGVDGIGTDWDEYTHEEPGCDDSCGDDRLAVTGPAHLNVPQPAALIGADADELADNDLGDLPSCSSLLPDPDAAPDSISWCEGDAETAKELDEQQSQDMGLLSRDWTSAIQPWCSEEPQRQWTGDRHYQCMWREDIAYLKYNQTGAPAGEVHYVTEYEQRAKWNSNVWEGRSAIHIKQAFGVATKVKYGGNITCISSGSCQTSGETDTHSIPVQTMDHLMEYTLKNPTVSGIASNTPYSQFTFVHPDGNPAIAKSPKTQFPTVRCDNVINNNTGCVVPAAEPILDLSTRAKAEAHAVHVRNAQRSGLPGAPNGTPLTRANQAQAQDNRNNTCNRVKAKRPDKTDCDEYPFASTIQGGSTTGVRTWTGSEVPLPGITILTPGTPQYMGSPGTSMAYISSSANRSGGGILTWFFRKNRVMEGESFYVKGKG